MQERIVEFVRGLRAGGVVVSTAEGLDAFAAVDLLGIQDRTLFRESLRATLIKRESDFEIFNELFPLYFSTNELPLQNAMEGLTGDEQGMLQQALEGFDDRISQLLEWLTNGDGPTDEQLQQMMQSSGIRWAESPASAVWVTRRMLQQMGFNQLEEKMAELAQRLRDLGMNQESIMRVMGVIEVNRDELGQFVSQQVRYEISKRRAEKPRDLHGSDLTHKSFQALSAADMDTLRREIRRLVTQLRTRAALRRKREHRGQFSARQTIRHSQRYGGVPLEIKFRKKKLKPDIVLIFDVSNSMQTMLEFLLYFVLEMQDQVSRLRSFAFYDNLGEVSEIVNHAHHNEMGHLFRQIQKAIPGYLFRTNLGYSLNTFYQNHLNSVRNSSTVIIIGDGRNNYADPRLDLVKDLQRRAKKLIWFTPESEQLWGSGDSDLDKYAPICDEVYLVKNLAQLSQAIDKSFT